MVIRNFAKYCALALVAMACTVKETYEQQAPTTSEPVVSDTEAGFLPGELSVEFDDQMAALIEEELSSGADVPTKAPGLSGLIKDLGIRRLERVFPDAGVFEPRSRAMGLHRFYTVVFQADRPATKAAEDFTSVPGVVSAHPARQIGKRGFSTPDDPYFSRQWHYVNTKNAGADINVKEVWEKYTTGSDKVVVCVVDECVDITHEDLKDNLWDDGNGNPGYNYARNNYDFKIRPESGYGDVGHGTHVAGTIAAVSNNGVGVAGVAGGDYANSVPGVRIMTHAIFSGSTTASDSKTARALKEGADKGAVISQNSWGLYADTNGDGRVTSKELADFKKYTIDDDPALKAAIDYFIQYAGCDAQGNQLPDAPMKGGLVFFACGNENIDYDVYSAYEPVIAVGAFRETGKKASYSNYGDWVDIAAPGGEGTTSSNSVWSTLPISSYISKDGYGGSDWAGTSMACPHVSGVAALIVSYFGGQGFTADQAKEILFAGLGDTIGGASPIGKQLNAAASFQWALDNGYAPGGAFEPGAPQISFDQNSVQLEDDEKASVKITVNDPAGGEVTLTCEDPGSDALSFDAETATALIQGGTAPAGTYSAVFNATSSVSGKTGTATLVYTLTVSESPKLSLDRNNLDLKFGETQTVQLTAEDPAQGEIVLSCEDPGSVALSFDPASATATILNNRDSKPGTYTAVFQATSQASGKSARAALVYTLQDALPPKMNLQSNFLSLKAHQTATVYVTASDPEGGAITLNCVDPGSDALTFDPVVGAAYLVARNAPAGTYEAVFSATSSVSGKETRTALVYTLQANRPPQVKSTPSDRSQTGLGALSFPLGDYFEDPDGEDLVYMAAFEGDVLGGLEITGGHAVLQPRVYGQSTLVFTATDCMGKTVQVRCRVALVNPDQPAGTVDDTVTDEVKITIESEEAQTVYVSIYNSSGSLVLSTVATASVFYSLNLDVSSLAPGRYTAVLKYGDEQRTVKFVKY